MTYDERRGPEHGEHEQRLLGGVRDGRDGVGGENGERGLLVQPLVIEPVRGERPAEHQSLEASQRSRRHGGQWVHHGRNHIRHEIGVKSDPPGIKVS